MRCCCVQLAFEDRAAATLRTAEERGQQTGERPLHSSPGGGGQSAPPARQLHHESSPLPAQRTVAADCGGNGGSGGGGDSLFIPFQKPQRKTPANRASRVSKQNSRRRQAASTTEAGSVERIAGGVSATRLAAAAAEAAASGDGWRLTKTTATRSAAAPRTPTRVDKPPQRQSRTPKNRSEQGPRTESARSKPHNGTPKRQSPTGLAPGSSRKPRSSSGIGNKSKEVLAVRATSTVVVHLYALLCRRIAGG